MPSFQEPTTSAPGFSAPEIVNSRLSALGGALQESMTTGVERYGHHDPNHSYNPTFDQRIWQVPPGPHGSARAPRLLRGRISQWKPEPQAVADRLGSKRTSRSLNFLYNPTTISHSFAMNPDIPPQSVWSEDDPSAAIMLGQSIAFKLLFNRQYEASYTAGGGSSGNASRRGENSSGVLADTQALQYMLGGWDGAAMAQVPIVVMFGATKDMKPFAFYGWIVNCSINYLMFTHRMIPTLAEVDLTMARSTTLDGLANTITSSSIGAANSANPRSADGQERRSSQSGQGVVGPANSANPRSERGARTAQSSGTRATSGGGFQEGVDPLNPNS